MPGLFIERHARSVAAHARVGVLYVHQDKHIQSGKVEVLVNRDEELLQVRMHFGEMTSRLSPLSRGINAYRYLRCHLMGLKIIKKELGRPDLIHVNVLTRLGVMAMLFKWFTGTPYVITEHWTRYLPHMDNFKGRLRKFITRMVVKRASAVLPVTDNLRRAMESHGLTNPNYRIIPNVVDVEMFRTGDVREADGKKRFIHVSCFEDKQKNISGILRVLKNLSTRRNDWECHMVGEGIHLERLMSYARELGIEGRYVIFHGLKENEELAGMMADAGFQVMFSRFENLPVVILESFACGVPVLSTDVGGIREHLHPELGILIPSENEAELEAKIGYFLDHYKDYDKARLRKYAVEHFSREVIGRQLFEVYSDVLQNP
jgi:glycosyltransferase involved in cell wall biosynthesis